MTIQESAEMYLETILILSKEKDSVRAIDVAKKLNYSKPSVSRAMKNLNNNGYISIKENGSIILLSEGEKIARKIYERHEVLTACFIRLGISEKTAEDDACRIEHVISDETFEAIKKFFKKQH
ncbi:MAG: metal-dependent transcriptional regulator [Erysipelotrichaceae bacterium]|jgi:Mn-dependent DtxR family transcriptional regulator|nr:metal-dependent transcriptional regulator [Erysipelotrichaceae bacterium]